VPGITSHPLAEKEELDSSALEIPVPGPANRLQVLVDAVKTVVGRIGGAVPVYACMSGPFSQAVELRGFNNLIMDITTAPDGVHRLMRTTTEFSLRQMERYAGHGASASIFESWAALPLITPDIFRDYVVPYNRRIIEMATRNFDVPVPAVIMGGDAARLMDVFLETGTSLVVADFTADFDVIKEKLRGGKVMIRGCVDPKMIERNQWNSLERSVRALAEKSAGMNNFVWGCGAVSFDTATESLLRFREMCLAEERKHRS
jgi:uroporphyrinogen decarboxylase